MLPETHQGLNRPLMSFWCYSIHWLISSSHLLIVWKHIFGIRYLTVENSAGFGKTQKFLTGDGIWSLLGKNGRNLGTGCGIRKENGIQVRDYRVITDWSSGCGIVVKKERECGFRNPPSRPCLLPHWGSKRLGDTSEIQANIWPINHWGILFKRFISYRAW